MVSQGPHPRGRALIVEDDYLIALDLEAAMSAIGFDVCDLAASDRQALENELADQTKEPLERFALPGP